MIRLAVRVAREHAETVLAELLELVPAGLEERRSGDDVEFVLYGAAGELPDVGEVQAAVQGALLDVSTSHIPDDWDERWRSFHTVLNVGRAPGSPAVGAGPAGRPGRGDRPGAGVRDRVASDDAARA